MYLDFNTLQIPDNIFAHKNSYKQKETLKEHSDLTKEYLNSIVENKKLSVIIDNLLEMFSEKHFNLLKRMFFNAVFLHDLGKKAPSFQRNKMENHDFEETTASSNHSFPSAKEYIKIFRGEIERIKDNLEFYKLIFILYNFAYQISKHHGKLESFKVFIDRIKDSDLNNSCKKLSELKIFEFEFYILNKLLFSLLVSSDYYATTEYMADFKTSDFGLFDKDKKNLFKKKFNEFIKGFTSNEGINKLRSKMFKEAEKNLLNNLDKNIFYLEAPTGSGKTITSINIALKLLENDTNLNKIFYIFPFNTLVEQTKKTFEDILEDAINIEVINSITPINTEDNDSQEKEESKYEKSYLNRLFFHNPIILTTHISLFSILFGTTKENNYPLWQLANSVIIIDEIQSYDNNLWWYMIEFFQKYAKNLNIKIIIMSATLPKLDNLLAHSKDFIDLIHNRTDYFESDYFKNRVNIDFSLLENDNFTKESEEFRIERIEKLVSVFEKEKKTNQKFLFEFIKKDSAREFYNLLKEKYENEFKIYELTGDDNKAYREFVISKTKENQKIVIVATQVIEAGVDIDMDIGFKDISTLDSEEQFMGRINRNCKKTNSKAYFFYLDNEQKIYRNDNRLEFNLRKKENRKWLEDKNFQDFYEKVLGRVGDNGKRIKSGLSSEIENFKKAVSDLDYKTINKAMKLIDSQNFTIFFPFMIEISQYKIKEFENIDKSLLENGFLDGKKVWQLFEDLNEIDNFAKMKVKKSIINSLFQFFTFSITKYDSNQTFPGSFDKEVGGIYYIENYQDFITDDLKFKRKEFQQECKSVFF